MKLSPRNVLIVAIAGVVVVAAVLIAAFIVPQLNKMGELSRQIEAANAEADQAKLVLEQRQSAKNRAAATEAELIALWNAVPETAELPSVIDELEVMSQESGLQFRSLVPEPPALPYVSTDRQPKAAYLVVPMTMEVFGSWADTVDFLQRLQRLPRQYRVVAVDSAYTETPPPQAPTPAPKVPILTTFRLEVYFIPAEGTPMVETD